MNADQQILTQLAKEYREVAFAPVNEERRALWKALSEYEIKGSSACDWSSVLCSSDLMKMVFISILLIP